MLYNRLVERRIRRRYSVSDELAILRQRDVKPEEFAKYNTFCEQCKAEARLVVEEIAKKKAKKKDNSNAED